MSKACNKCKITKEFNMFIADARNKDGLQGICNTCRNKDKQIQRDTKAANGNYLEIHNKSCNKCLITKDIGSFFADKGTKDGKSTICKACKKENVYKWRVENKDKYNADMKAYLKARPEMRYGIEIKRRYGCSLEMYNAMLIKQEGKCAICSKLHNPAVKKGRLFVDHDHKTGAIRALLCGSCNLGLGYFADDNRVMLEAVAYVIKYNKA